jgi:hypothetical protein
MSIESCAMLVRVLAAGIASEFPEIREKLDAAQVSSDVSRVAAKK